MAEWRTPAPPSRAGRSSLAGEAGRQAREMILRCTSWPPEANWCVVRYGLASNARWFVFPQDAFEKRMKPRRWLERNYIYCSFHKEPFLCGKANSFFLSFLLSMIKNSHHFLPRIARKSIKNHDINLGMPFIRLTHYFFLWRAEILNLWLLCLWSYEINDENEINTWKFKLL